MATKDIKLPPSSLVDEEEKVATCPLCLKEASKYTCPRCNIRYCSVSCYKSEKHMNCSESFYRDCFMEGLKERSVDPEEKSRIMEMLERVEQEDVPGNDSDDEEEDLHERLGELDLDKDTGMIWDKLTEKEKKEFQCMMSDGRLGNLVEIWTPWWCARDTKLVTEMDKRDSTSNPRPLVKHDVPHITSLLPNTKPAADLKYGVVNVLYAYAFTCRLHNGDHLKQASDSTRDILKVSSVIGESQTFESTREAIQACLAVIEQPRIGFDTTRQFNVSVISDVTALIEGPGERDPLLFLMCALSDLNTLLNKSYKAVGRQIKKVKCNPKQQELTAFRKKLFKCCKQTEFFLSWTQTYGMAMKCLILELKMEESVLTSDLDEVKETSKQFEVEWGGKVKKQPGRALIEEIK